MRPTRRQLAVVHIAKKELGLSEEEYRSILLNVAGARSSTELDSIAFQLVMEHFRSCGWEARDAGRSYGFRPGMASPGQLALIRDLWDEYTAGEGTDRQLGKWLERTFKVSDLRFLSVDQTPKAIGALRAMVARSREAREHQREGENE